MKTSQVIANKIVLKIFRKRLGIGLTCFLTGSAVLIGCGKEEPAVTVNTPADVNHGMMNSAPAAKPAGGGVTLAGLDAVTKAHKSYKIVLIVKTRNNPFFTPMIKAFEQTARDLGVKGEVQTPAQENDTAKQFALVQDEIGKGVDAICIAPADSKGIVPALKEAQSKGILIVNIDNRVDVSAAQAQGLDLGGYVGADNVAGGKLAGQTMLTALGGKGSVVVLEGIRGTDNAEARKRGFMSVVDKKLKVDSTEAANWDQNTAYQKTANLLTRYPDVKGVFCANDKMAVGALQALSEAGKKGKVVLIGYDNIPDVQAALKSGDMRATIEQHPDLMGKYGLKMAVGILNGNLSKGGEILVPLEVIKTGSH